MLFETKNNITYIINIDNDTNDNISIIPTNNDVPIIINTRETVIPLFELVKDKIIYLEVDNRDIRKIIHIEAKKRNMIARTYYEYDGQKMTEIKCDNCRKFTSTKDSVNACCDSGCNSTARYIICQHCDIGDCDDDDDYNQGRIFYDWEDGKNDGKNRIKKIYKSTSRMILLTKNTPYKHLNTSKGSYRKKRYHI